MEALTQLKVATGNLTYEWALHALCRAVQKCLQQENMCIPGRACVGRSLTCVRPRKETGYQDESAAHPPFTPSLFSLPRPEPIGAAPIFEEL